MRKAMLATILGGMCALTPMFAQEASTEKIKNTVFAKDSGGGNVVTAFFGSLEWYIWLLLIVLVVLIGVFFYVRNRQVEE
jgi:hypothetical protein